MRRQDISVPRLNSAKEKAELLDAIYSGGIYHPLECGGMGVDFSNEHLASPVIEEGFIPTLALSACGFNSRREEILAKPNSEERIALYRQANIDEACRQISYVRERHPHSVLAANIMCAMTDFREMVEAIGKSGGVDIIFTGAGFSRDLTKIMEQFPHMRYVPIVSSEKAAEIWARASKRTSRSPDAFYVELPQFAGGHLGAGSVEDATNEKNFRPEKLVEDIRGNEHVKKINERIPLLLGGGIAYKEDIQQALNQGYNGVVMGTRFLLTQESGLPDNLIRDVYLSARYRVSTGMTSPAGLPSRYLGETPNDITSGVAEETRRQCVKCISIMGKPCGFMLRGDHGQKKSGDFCIKEHLPDVSAGRVLPGEKAVLFTGSHIEDTRNDSLYRKSGEPYVPTVHEMAEVCV